jgi:hypothetical protein
MTISIQTLENNIYTTFRLHFTSGTYALSSISNSAQVTPKYSDDISSQYGFPVIEIGDPEINTLNTDRFGAVKLAEVTIPILVVEDNSADAKTTMDDLRYKIISGNSVFRAVNLQDIKIVESGNTTIGKNKKNYYYKRIGVQCTYRERI